MSHKQIDAMHKKMNKESQDRINKIGDLIERLKKRYKFIPDLMLFDTDYDYVISRMEWYLADCEEKGYDISGIRIKNEK